MNSFPVLSGNLISWIIQVSVIALFGAALPILFRIRHPRTQLAYCHAVLVVCIVLPLIEPRQHLLMLTVRSAMETSSHLESGISMSAILGWIIAVGMLARLIWLAGGILQIRRFRSSAAPISPIPDSIYRARALTQSDARFGISCHVDGPATIGYVDPMILLPEPFPSLDHEAQLSIACHELLHVKRNDWLITLAEEIVASAFWFNPAIWWLLSQAKLSREQLVDSEVVSLTSAPASYVHALLAMAGAAKGGKGLKIVPATPFLTEGHLPRRIRALLTNQKGSLSRLFLSYSSIAVLLLVTGWAAMLWFPLVGDAVTIKHTQKRLIAAPWTRAFVVTDTTIPASPTFNLRVIPPPLPTGDVLYVQREIVDPPAPSPSLLQPFGIVSGPEVRMLRPGDRVNPEDIARMQAELGDHTILEVTQSEDGTVQRITVRGRRIPDEINTGNTNFGFGSERVISAGPAGLLGVH